MLRRVLPAANAIFLGHVIARLGSLILVPLFLKYWSATRYGEYLALFAAITYLGSLDIGMQQAVINRLTQAYAKGDFETYRAIQHTAMTFYVVLACIVTLIVAGLSWILPLSQWMGIRLTGSSTVGVVVTLLAMCVMWSMPMRLMTAAYQTTGNLARTQWIANMQQVLVVTVSAIALLMGGGMLSIALAQLLTVALFIGLVLLDLRRDRILFPGFSARRFSALKELAHPSLLFALLLVGNLIAYQGSTVLVSAAMGGLAVAIVSISKAVIDVIRQALYSITLALAPDFARLEVLGEFATLRKIHRMMMASTGAITIGLAGAAWYEGAQVIAVWTRGRIEADVTLLRLFLILLVLQTPWAASSTIATSTNRHRAQAVGYFIAAVLGVLLVAAFVPSLGTWAVPLGLILGEAAGCYHFVIKATCQIIGESYPAFALRFWLGFATVSAATLAIGWVIHNLMPGPTMLRWALVTISTCVTAAACGWIVWLTPNDRALLIPMLRPELEVSTAKAA